MEPRTIRPYVALPCFCLLLYAMEFALNINNLKKTYRTRVAGQSWAESVQQFLRPKHRNIEAIRGISFAVRPGEKIAFVGPNGAGKSTTIKILTGILHPTDGSATVMGYVPWKDRRRLSYSTGTVFGQRSQLWYHLPVGDTLKLLGKVYNLAPNMYRDRLHDLVQVFEIEALLQTPVRQLSLGQRMRCELVASLLHRPKILLLDEPSIGLDVSAKAAVRDLINSYSQREGTTVLLTSHDTGDMEQVCDRIILINHGLIVLDYTLEELRKRYIKKKVLEVQSSEAKIDVDISPTSKEDSLHGVTVIERKPHKTTLEVDLEQISLDKVVRSLVSKVSIRDLTIQDPPLEEIMQLIYREHRVE